MFVGGQYHLGSNEPQALITISAMLVSWAQRHCRVYFHGTERATNTFGVTEETNITGPNHRSESMRVISLGGFIGTALKSVAFVTSVVFIAHVERHKHGSETHLMSC